MEISKTNKGLIAIGLLSVVALLAVKSIYKKSNEENMLGQTCKFDSGPDGTVVFDFPVMITGQNYPIPSLNCKRCNQTGCRTDDVK